MRMLYINGIEYPGILLENWNIAKKINSISTLKCGIININFNQQIVDISSIIEGSSIELFNGENKMFSGIVKIITKSVYVKGITKLELSCNDNSEIAKRRIIAQSIVNKTSGWIARNAILPVLSEEGVTEGVIDEGFLMTRANFNYIGCDKALDYLQTCTGMNWYIDYDKKLNFHAADKLKSPFNLDNIQKYSNFKSSRKYEQYRNVQYILGGKSITSPQIHEELTPAPNGEIIEFYTRFGVYQKPVLEVYNGATWNQVSSDDIGVDGIDTNKKWYFTYGSKIIKQDSAETVLAAGQKVRSTYIGLKNIFIAYSNDAEVGNRANIENSSGKYENFERNETLETTAEASEYAQAILKKYGEIEDRISFDTELSGLEPGQLLKVINENFGINQDFLIESVNIKPIGSTSILYSVSALDGISLGGWETYFKMLVAASQDTIAPDENIILIKQVSDTSNVASAIDMTILSQRWLYCGDNHYCGDTIAGHIQRSEVALSE